MISKALPTRVAVIHDWLTGMRGGEKVLEGILELFPSADIFTLFHFPGSVSAAIEAHSIRTSSLQRWAPRVRDYRRLLPFFAGAVEEWNLEGYELIVSSSHCVANGAAARGVAHLSYCHTPMRYIWDRFDDYFPPSRPLLRASAHVLAWRLRRWDVRTARRVDQFIANSHFVAERIERYYGRQSRVIHPFVDERFFSEDGGNDRDPFHLVISALVPYKRVDLVIEAARRSRSTTIRILGDGPLRSKLARGAPPNVQFLGFVSDEVIAANVRRAQTLILPGIEDFGIAPLEAMAAGTPVVALRAGGALETVIEGKTGCFFDAGDPDRLVDALREAETTTWHREFIRDHAASFSKARFLREMHDAVSELMGSQS